jgi:hypothetical protein
MGRAVRVAGVLVALLVRPGCVTLPALAAEGQGRPAGTPRPPVSLAFVAEPGKITAGEPLLARVVLVNRAAHATEIVLGGEAASYLHLEILGEDGHVLAATPRPDPLAEGITGLAALQPGEQRTWFWVVTGLYRFGSPGRHTLRLRLLGKQEGLPVLAEASTALAVGPYDAARLDARCEELLEPLRRHRSLGGLDISCRTKALYSVRDDIVLPYVDWIAREWADQYACRAIKRIGTPRALRLLEALQKRTDRVGQAARSLPQMHMPDFTMWDVVCD